MPLTKRQFELGITDDVEHWMRLVYNLLAEHKDLAYSQEEIIANLLGESPSPDETGLSREYEKYRDHLHNVGRALGVLVEIGAVEQRKVGYQEYYAFQQELDTDSWNRKRPF